MLLLLLLLMMMMMMLLLLLPMLLLQELQLHCQLWMVCGQQPLPVPDGAIKYIPNISSHLRS